MNRVVNRLVTLGSICLISAFAPALHAQQAQEIQASSNVIGDIEFDWGRDGVPCASCNFGESNDRFNWTDRSNNLWIGHIDPVTGAFTPPLGENEHPDNSAFFWAAWGNGPEWAFSTVNGQIISDLVYSRFKPGEQAVAGWSGAGYATMVAGSWVPAFLPGAFVSGESGGAGNSALPEASQCISDPNVAYDVYQNLATPQQMFTDPVNGTGEPALTPFGAYANGIGERFVPCQHDADSPVGGTRWLTFQGNAPPNAEGNVYQQVFWYDLDTQVVQQLTTDPSGKQRGLMFLAPEFLNSPLNPNMATAFPLVLLAVSANTTVFIYIQTGTNANGSPIMTLINTVNSPEAAEPYIFDPKPFIHCTPICQTYFVYSVSKSSTSQNGITIPNGLAVANINPAAQINRLLVSGLKEPLTQRLDPKFFITTQNGPQVYYNLIDVESSKQRYLNLGTWYINMGLGAPTGDCVGSSPLEGLNPNLLAFDPMCIMP
jgi:hypothetical protein